MLKITYVAVVYTRCVTLWRYRHVRILDAPFVSISRLYHKARTLTHPRRTISTRLDENPLIRNVVHPRTDNGTSNPYNGMLPIHWELSRA